MLLSQSMARSEMIGRTHLYGTPAVGTGVVDLVRRSFMRRAPSFLQWATEAAHSPSSNLTANPHNLPRHQERKNNPHQTFSLLGQILGEIFYACGGTSLSPRPAAMGRVRYHTP